MMTIIPETRRAHYNWYLRLYYVHEYVFNDFSF